MDAPSPPDDSDNEAPVDGDGSQKTTRLPPSMARLYGVAAGIVQWTTEERSWLAQNPKWLEYEERLRQAIRSFSEGHEPDDKWFSELLRQRRRPKDDPPSRA